MFSLDGAPVEAPGCGRARELLLGEMRNLGLEVVPATVGLPGGYWLRFRES